MEFIKDIEEEEYSAFVSNHQMSHFLKSYEWGQAAKMRNLVPHYIGVKEEGKLVATALLLEKRLPLGYSYFYVPRGYTIDYSNKELLSIFTKMVVDYTKSRKSLFFKIDPDIKLHNIDKDAKVINDGINNYELVSLFKKIGFKHEKLNVYFENMQPRFTFRVNVTDDMEVIRKRYSKSVIRWVKIADKYNIQVEVGKKENVSEFVELMKMTEKRQGFFSHSYDFYEGLYDLFIKNNSISVLLARVNIKDLVTKIDEEILACETDEKKEKLIGRKELYLSYGINETIAVSSYINVHYGNKSWYLFGANNLDFKDTYANYKLFDFQIEHAHNLNKEILDEFGTIGDPTSTKSVAGLHEFKKKFGGEYTEFIGEFTYITKPFMNFVFNTLIPLYRKPGRFIRRLKVKLQGGKK